MVINFNHIGCSVGGILIGGSSGCGLCPWRCSGKVGAYANVPVNIHSSVQVCNILEWGTWGEYLCLTSVLYLGEKTIKHASYQYHTIQNYLMKTKHPLIPVTCIKEGQESKDFNAVFN